MGRPKITSPIAIARQQRIAAILNLRLAGWTLQAIGDAQSPPITRQSVFELLVRALRDMVLEPYQEARRLELARLDALQVACWPAAIKGKGASVDRVLSIVDRRARLAGLYPQPLAAVGVEAIDPERVKVEIVNLPDG
jgi:hypothetical protein